MNNELYNRVACLSQLVNRFNDSSFDGILLTVKAGSSSFSEIKAELEKQNIVFEHSLQEDFLIEIKKSKLGVKLFFDDEIFLKDFKLDDINQDFAILKHNKSFLYFSFTDNSCYVDSKPFNTYTLIENSIAYLKLLDKLSEVCDYKNSSNNELIFYTSTRGIYKLKYPNPYPIFQIRI